MLAAGNCLKSYLLDLYMYETSKIRYNDFACLTGPPTLTPASYNFLSHISSNVQMSRALASRQNFINLYDSNSYKLKTPNQLKQLMTSQITGIPPQHSATDLHTVGYLSLIPMFTNNEKIISTRKYERTYNIMYNEKSSRDNLEFAAAYRVGGNATRNQYDGFSLRVAVDKVSY